MSEAKKIDPLYEPFKLYPVKYPFAMEYFNTGLSNTWFPQEVPLGEDIYDWQHKLTEEDKKCFKLFLSFFGTAEGLVANNIVLSLYALFTEPEIRLYLGRQAFEELLQTVSFNYIIDTLNLDRAELYAIEKKRDIYEKEIFLTNMTKMLRETKFKTEHERIRMLLKNLWTFYGILEGLFFFSGFLIGLMFENKQLLKNSAVLIRYTLRDESVHLAFGFDLMRAIIAEHPKIMTDDFKKELAKMIKAAVDLEIKYAKQTVHEKIVGITAEQYAEHVKYIADRRLESISLPKIYKIASPMKWATTISDLPELINFFEAKPFDYQFRVSTIA
jgi:ribonucleoside-diphosphate reductase beta chain